MNKEKKIEDEGISMPGVRLWQELGEESYKYLEALDADRIKMEEMKENVTKQWTHGQLQQYVLQLEYLIGLLMSYNNIITTADSW